MVSSFSEKLYLCLYFKSGEMINKDEKRTQNELKSGCLKAFEKIYNQYSAKLYNYVLKISQGDRYLAEEVVQTAFMRLWEIRKQVDPDKPILFLLGRIARNILINIYQHQTVEYVYANYVVNHRLEADNAMEEDANLNFLNEYIDELTGKLPPVRRKVFELSKRGYYSNKEIAVMMNLSESTVATHLALALKFIREKLLEHYDDVIFLLICFLSIKYNSFL